jgi:hypothetical protein
MTASCLKKKNCKENVASKESFLSPKKSIIFKDLKKLLPNKNIKNF